MELLGPGLLLDRSAIAAKLQHVWASSQASAGHKMGPLLSGIMAERVPWGPGALGASFTAAPVPAHADRSIESGFQGGQLPLHAAGDDDRGIASFCREVMRSNRTMEDMAQADNPPAAGRRGPQWKSCFSSQGNPCFVAWRWICCTLGRSAPWH